MPSLYDVLYEKLRATLLRRERIPDGIHATQMEKHIRRVLFKSQTFERGRAPLRRGIRVLPTHQILGAIPGSIAVHKKKMRLDQGSPNSFFKEP